MATRPCTSTWSIPEEATTGQIVMIRQSTVPRRHTSGRRHRHQFKPSGQAANYGVTVTAAALITVPSAVVMLIVPVTARSGTVNDTSVGDEATTAAATAPTLIRGRTPSLEICSGHDDRALQRGRARSEPRDLWRTLKWTRGRRPVRVRHRHQPGDRVHRHHRLQRPRRHIVGTTGPADPGERHPGRSREVLPEDRHGRPHRARAGENAVACGGCTTVRFVALSPAPSTVVTLIGPVTAPSGIRNLNSVAVLTREQPRRDRRPADPVRSASPPAPGDSSPSRQSRRASTHRAPRVNPAILGVSLNARSC